MSEHANWHYNLFHARAKELAKRLKMGQLRGHKKIFPIPGVNTSGYCSHLKPFSVRMKGMGAKDRGSRRGGNVTSNKIVRTPLEATHPRGDKTQYRPAPGTDCKIRATRVRRGRSGNRTQYRDDSVSFSLSSSFFVPAIRYSVCASTLRCSRNTGTRRVHIYDEGIKRAR